MQKYNIFWSKIEMSDLYIIFRLKFLSWRTSASCGLKVEPDLEGGLVLLSRTRTRTGLMSLSLIEKTFDRVLWQFHLSCDHPNHVAWKLNWNENIYRRFSGRYRVGLNYSCTWRNKWDSLMKLLSFYLQDFIVLLQNIVFVRKLDNLSELFSNKIKKLVLIKAVKQD